MRNRFSPVTHFIHYYMKKTRFDLVYNRKKNENIELRVYFDRKTSVFISTNVKIAPQYWDAAKQAVKGSFTNSAHINAYLQKLRNKYEQMEMDCIIKDIPFTKDFLQSILRGDKPDAGRFSDYVRAKLEIEMQQRMFAPGTERELRSFCNVIERFDRDFGVITFANFNKDKLTQLEIWLKSRYNPATTRRKLINFQKYVRLAVQDKKMRDNPFDDFTITRPKTEQKRDAINSDELQRIEALAESGELPPDLQLVADRFLLSCYCGLRISDNADLRQTDIAEDENGNMIIDRLTIKTKTRVILPLHHLFDGKPERIVGKYMTATRDTIFPPLSDQKTNIKLKTLAALAGLRNLQLTFHIARHTCATMLAEKTGNPFTIMQILGHNDIKTSMGYIHNSYRAVVNSLNNVNW